MNEKAVLDLYRHLSGNPKADLKDLAKAFKQVGHSPAAVMETSPFDILRLKDVMDKLDKLEKMVDLLVNGTTSVGTQTWDRTTFDDSGAPAISYPGSVIEYPVIAPHGPYDQIDSGNIIYSTSSNSTSDQTFDHE